MIFPGSGVTIHSDQSQGLWYWRFLYALTKSGTFGSGANGGGQGVLGTERPKRDFMICITESLKDRQT